MTTTLIPGAIIPWVDRQFCDANGAPVAGGKLYAFEAGTDTPANVYADSDLTTPLTNPVILDSSGRALIFLDAFGYRFVLTDANDVQLWDIDDIADLAQLYLQVLGVATTTASVTSGYSVISTDNLITVFSTSGPNPCLIYLQPAADRKTPLTIKVTGDVPVQVVASSGETIEAAATYDLPVAAPPIYPSIFIRSDGVSTYWIDASHGL